MHLSSTYLSQAYLFIIWLLLFLKYQLYSFNTEFWTAYHQSWESIVTSPSIVCLLNDIGHPKSPRHPPVSATYERVQIKTGNGHFLAYIPSWWYIQPSLMRLGNARPPLSLYLPSRAKLWCTLQLRGQIHSSYFFLYSFHLCNFSPQRNVYTSPSLSGVKEKKTKASRGRKRPRLSLSGTVRVSVDCCWRKLHVGVGVRLYSMCEVCYLLCVYEP